MSVHLERSSGLDQKGLLLSVVRTVWLPSLVGLAALVLFILVLFHQTLWSMVDQWATSETYTHGFFIVPISGWLIWRRREALLGITPQPDSLAIPVLAALGMMWLVGEFAAVEVIKQYAVVAMLVTSVWLVAGHRLLRAWRFPLFFLFLAVPFGYFLVLPLMQFTADCTVTLVRLSGIPVYREGFTFTLPTGTWSVIEACSGLRYLIASFTLGCLYAYLTYRSRLRRVLFVLASIVVPIIANGLRAYVIVMIGHLSSMRLATGIDHLVYGWVFFGLVMLVLFWTGSLWREDARPNQGNESQGNESDKRSEHAAASKGGRLAVSRMIVLIGLAASLLAAGPLYATRVNARQAEISTGASLALPSGVSGWQTARPFIDWKPHYLNFSEARSQGYVHPAGPLGLYIALYRNQVTGSELIGWGNDIVFDNSSSRSDWYRVAAPRDRTVLFQGKTLPVRITRISNGRQYLDVWHWYWVDGQFTTSAMVVKALTLKARLMARSDAAALIAVYVPVIRDEAGSDANVAGFIKKALPAIERNLAAVAGG